MVICLERGADLHIAQLMPLPLTVSCFSKIQICCTFLVPAHPGSPGQGPLNGIVVVVVVVVYAARRSAALTDTMIRPSVCPSPRRAAALGYRHDGCLQLSHVWTADRSADGRRSAASRPAIDGGDIVSPRPGAIPFTLHYLSTVYYAPITTLTAYYRLNIKQQKIMMIG